MGKIMAVCISEKRGTQKKNIEKVRLIENFGLEGDAHGGKSGEGGVRFVHRGFRSGPRRTDK